VGLTGRASIEDEINKLDQVKATLGDRKYRHSLVLSDTSKVIVDSKEYLAAIGQSDQHRKTILEEFSRCIDKLVNDLKSVRGDSMKRRGKLTAKLVELDSEIEVPWVGS